MNATGELVTCSRTGIRTACEHPFNKTFDAADIQKSPLGGRFASLGDKTSRREDIFSATRCGSLLFVQLDFGFTTTHHDNQKVGQRRVSCIQIFTRLLQAKTTQHGLPKIAAANSGYPGA